MKKVNLKNEKIQTNATEEIESENLQKRSEQNAKEKSDVAPWRTCAVAFLNQSIDEHSETSLLSYTYSRLIDSEWSPWVPYSSYIHFTSGKIDLKSIILGSLDNLDVGTYRFKLLSLFRYDHFWYLSSFSDIHWNLDFVLEIKVFENNGVKGFEVLGCFDIDEFLSMEGNKKNEI